MFVKELSWIPGGSAEVAFASIEEGQTFGRQNSSCSCKAAIMLNFVKELSKISGVNAEVAFASIGEGYTFGIWVFFLLQ